jgi:hypothetical protein
MSAICIQDGCGMSFDSNQIETRDTATLRPFWQNYCPKHRVAVAEQAKRAKRNKARRERNQLMRDCGLTRGRDSLGRVIWE